MTGATASLPNLTASSNASANAQSGLSGFLSVATALTGDGEGSPLSGIVTVLGDLQSTLNIDISGLSEQLPQALTVIENAVPADTLQFIKQLEGAYAAVNDFLNNSELVKQIQSSASLEETALAVIDDALDLFRERLDELGSSLVDKDTLESVKTALQTLENLANGGDIPADQLLDFLADNLVGVAANLLEDTHNELQTSLNFLEPLSASSLDSQFSVASENLAQSVKDIGNFIVTFDAGDASAYPALENLLSTYSQAVQAVFSTATAVYGGLNTVVSAPQWASLFQLYTEALNALPLDDIPTVNDAIDELATFMESLLARLTMSLSPQDLATQVERLNTSIHTLFADSPLYQVRQILIDFISEIENAIAAVPTEEVQNAVDSMLSQVGTEIQGLGLDQVRTTIETGFQTANDFITDNIGNDLLTDVNDQLAAALQQLNNVPIAELGESITSAVEQAGQVITDLESNLSSGLDQIKSLLANLDNLDFKPVSNEVIDEIQALKTKLQAINPNALSDVEKIAIQAGLALLSAIDLEGEIVVNLKGGFGDIADELAKGIQAVLEAWLEFRRRIGTLDATALAAPITGLLDDINNVVQGLNSSLLLSPLQDLIDQMMAQLQQLSPAVILDPLQAPYDQVMQTINKVNPDVWIQPLRPLHTEIDRLVNLIDITPLLVQLEDKEKQLFAEVNQSVFDALDSVQLPAPLDAFYDQIKILIQSLSDALFGDPDGTLRNFSVGLSDSLRPSMLFQPLDAAFDQLLAAINTLPADQVLSVLETLRSGLGTVLPAMDPNNVIQGLREAEARLDDMSPANLAIGAVRLPALKAQLEISFEAHTEHASLQASLLAQFDVSMAPLQFNDVNSGLYQLHQSHQQLVTSLHQQVNNLDAQDAQLAYRRLNTNLRRLLPDFLLQTTPLQISDVQASLAGLRPSAKARRLDSAVDRFIAEVKPLESALETSMNGFFGEIRQAARMLYPGDIKDAVADVYQTLRDKLHILDPDELAADLRANVWEPLIDPLDAINPSTLKAPLQSLYENLLSTLTGSLDGLLDTIKVSLDAFINEIREAVAGILDALIAQINDILGGVNELIEKIDNLIVEDLFNRLLNLLENLKTSFNLELDRVRNEFDAMLNAIPLGGSASASLGVG